MNKVEGDFKHLQIHIKIPNKKMNRTKLREKKRDNNGNVDNMAEINEFGPKHTNTHITFT